MKGTNTASAAYVRFAAVDYTESLAGDGLAVAVVAVQVDAVDVLRQLLTNIAVGKFAIVVILAIDPYGEDGVGQGEDCGEDGEGGSRKMHSEGCDGLEWGSC